MYSLNWHKTSLATISWKVMRVSRINNNKQQQERHEEIFVKISLFILSSLSSQTQMPEAISFENFNIREFKCKVNKKKVLFNKTNSLKLILLIEFYCCSSNSWCNVLSIKNNLPALLLLDFTKLF